MPAKKSSMDQNLAISVVRSMYYLVCNSLKVFFLFEKFS